MNLSEEQLKAFEKLWFIYGNDGRKCTFLNHKLVQGFYEHHEDRRKPYLEGHTNMVERHGKEYADKHAVTQECIDVCTLVLENKIDEALQKAKS